MNDDAPPPAQPEISPRDRALLRERLTALFKGKRLSGRKVEKVIGVATGTLSKIFSGKMALTHRLLHELCTLLEVTAESIVENTAFAQLLTTAVATPETELVKKLRAELDALRVEKEVLSASLAHAHEELADHRKQLAEAAATNRKLDERNSELASELSAARSELENLRQEATHADQKQRHALVVASGEREQRTAALAKIVALTQLVEQWRTHANEREQRVAQLEALAQHLQAKVNGGTGTAVGAALGTGVLALMLGVAIGKDS